MTIDQRLHQLARTLLWASCICISPVFAQTNEKMVSNEIVAADWTAGEIRKLDKSTGKLTIRHEDIKSLNMPAMTMVFTAKDEKMIDGFKVGDKIQFIVIQEQGKLVLTDLKSN